MKEINLTEVKFVVRFEYAPQFGSVGMHWNAYGSCKGISVQFIFDGTESTPLKGNGCYLCLGMEIMSRSDRHVLVKTRVVRPVVLDGEMVSFCYDRVCGWIGTPVDPLFEGFVVWPNKLARRMLEESGPGQYQIATGTLVVESGRKCFKVSLVENLEQQFERVLAGSTQ